MGHDVAPAAAARIGAQDMPQAVREPDDRGAAHRRAEGVGVAGREAEERDEVGAGPVTVDVGFGESDFAAERQPAKGPPPLDDEGRLKAELFAARKGAAVGKPDPDAAAAQPRERGGQETDEPRRAGKLRAGGRAVAGPADLHVVGVNHAFPSIMPAILKPFARPQPTRGGNTNGIGRRFTPPGGIPGGEFGRACKSHCAARAKPS